MHWRVVQREDEYFRRTVALFVMFNWKGLVQKSWAWKKEWLNIKMERTGFFSKLSSIFQTLSLVEYSIRAWNGLPIMSNSKHKFFRGEFLLVLNLVGFNWKYDGFCTEYSLGHGNIRLDTGNIRLSTENIRLSTVNMQFYSEFSLFDGIVLVIQWSEWMES